MGYAMTGEELDAALAEFDDLSRSMALQGSGLLDLDTSLTPEHQPTPQPGTPVIT